MKSSRPPLFWKRRFEPHVIVTCVRCYLRFSLSFRDVKELMAERGLAVDYTTIWRWTQTYGPEVYRRLHGGVKRKSSTWHMDETFVRIAGKWMYLFRAVDSQGQTVDFYLSETRDREAAKLFLQRVLANPDNRPPHVFARDGLRSYPAALEVGDRLSVTLLATDVQHYRYQLKLRMAAERLGRNVQIAAVVAATMFTDLAAKGRRTPDPVLVRTDAHPGVLCTPLWPTSELQRLPLPQLSGPRQARNRAEFVRPVISTQL